MMQFACLFEIQQEPSRPGRRAFTFIEVLFAIIILAIGFIMIAAIFPAAAVQTQATADDTAGVAVAQYTIKSVSSLSFSDSNYSGLLTEKDLPTPNPNNCYPNGIGKVFSFNDPRFAGKPTVWPVVDGNLIYPSNPAYAAVLMYRRDIPAFALQSNLPQAPASGRYPILPTPNASPSNYADVIAIAVRARNRSFYQFDPQNPAAPSDVMPSSSGGNATLDPLLIDSVALRTVTDPTTGLMEDVADFSNAKPYSGNNQDLKALATGTIVVISDDTSSNYPAGCYGWSNGMIFRLGSFAPEFGANAWRLDPSTTLSKYAWPVGVTPGVSQAGVFIVGRGWSTMSRNSPNGEYDGQAQEMGYATGIIPLK